MAVRSAKAKEAMTDISVDSAWNGSILLQTSKFPAATSRTCKGCLVGGWQFSHLYVVQLTWLIHVQDMLGHRLKRDLRGSMGRISTAHHVMGCTVPCSNLFC